VQDARRRLFANKAAVTSMVILSIVAFLSVVMPFVWPHQFDQVYIDRISCPPPDYLGMTAIFGSQADACPAAVVTDTSSARTRTDATSSSASCTAGAFRSRLG